MRSWCIPKELVMVIFEPFSCIKEGVLHHRRRGSLCDRTSTQSLSVLVSLWKVWCEKNHDKNKHTFSIKSEKKLGRMRPKFRPPSVPVGIHWRKKTIPKIKPPQKQKNALFSAVFLAEIGFDPIGFWNSVNIVDILWQCLTCDHVCG